MTASAGDSTDARPRLRRSQRERTSWLQVRGVIMSRIAEGIYPPGELIPTEIELASEFGCARATVNRALAALADRGVLDRRRRIGTRVAPNLIHPGACQRVPRMRDMVEAEGRRFRFQFLGVSGRAPPPDVCERMFCSDPAALVETCTLFYSDERLICAERRWHDSRALPELLPALGEETTANDWVSGNAPVTGIEQRISAHLAGSIDAAEMLGCPPEAAVLQYETCLWTAGAPVSLSRHAMQPGEVMATRIR